MKYIRGAIYIHLILISNGSGVLKWWVGEPYAVHLNMQVYTGGGAFHGKIISHRDLDQAESKLAVQLNQRFLGSTTA